jgi:hypothetical protein
MDKVLYRRLQTAWNDFDRSTAMGRAQRGKPYDPLLCQVMWNRYNLVLHESAIPPFPRNYHRI